MAPSPLVRLGVAQSWEPERIIALVFGYFDESGEHASGSLQRLTLGGFFSTWEAVQELEREWRSALAAESMGEFHMKEFASDEHNYAGWPVARQQRLDRFVSIVCRHAVSFAGFTYAPARPRRFYDAYEKGLARVLIEASSLSDRLSRTPHGRGSVIFAKTEEISIELIGRYFDRLKWGEFLDGFAVYRSRDNPSLQAAEVMARGMRRLMQDGTVTHSFRRILLSGRNVSIWPRDVLGVLASRGIVLKEPGAV